MVHRIIRNSAYGESTIEKKMHVYLEEGVSKGGNESSISVVDGDTINEMNISVCAGDGEDNSEKELGVSSEERSKKKEKESNISIPKTLKE